MVVKNPQTKITVTWEAENTIHSAIHYPDIDGLSFREGDIIIREKGVIHAYINSEIMRVIDFHSELAE